MQKFLIVDEGWYVERMPVDTDGCSMVPNFDSGLQYETKEEVVDALIQIKNVYAQFGMAEVAKVFEIVSKDM